MSSDFYDDVARQMAPLPGRLRPKNWDDFVGHEKLIARLRNRPVRSMILYGPPGTGKTTLARILAMESRMDYRELSAVSSGVKDVREVIQQGKTGALSGHPVLLFIDEIHRFSKSQQDALLQAVESGWITLIGATTENPSFEVIGPLLSRCQVIRLESLSEENLVIILNRAMERDVSLAGITMDDGVRNILAEAAGGDARKLLRWIEIVADDIREVPDPERGMHLSEDRVKEILKNTVRQYDKLGDNHYDYISAFIKSMRGSDPDAALVYLACMIEGGEDPLFIARRMIIFASEDIGNAFPDALAMAVSAFQALERIGMPEGRIILGQTATYLASVPKSNASYSAIDEALATIRGKRFPIPNHLRNAPTATHRMEGAGKGYLYPHDYPGNFVKQQYLPAGYENFVFYRPTNQGMEVRFKERLERLRPERYGSSDESASPDDSSSEESL